MSKAEPHLHVGEHQQHVHPLGSDASKWSAVEAHAKAEDEEPVNKDVPDVGEDGNVHGRLDNALGLQGACRGSGDTHRQNERAPEHTTSKQCHNRENVARNATCHL